MNVLNNKYPKTLGEEYTIKVRVADGWQDKKIARLHISVGQDYHEGAKFQATMDWARKNFDRVIVCVNDTLQRHNFLFQGKSIEEAHDVSKQMGEEWIERNTTAEMRTDPDIQIVRWDDWMHMDNYDETLKKVREQITANTRFGDTIEAEASNFWERNKVRRKYKTDRKKDSFLKHSRAYLLEECAVFSMMFDRAEAADIYPGSTLIPCQLFKPEKIAKRGFTRVDFKTATMPMQSSIQGRVSIIGPNVKDALVRRGTQGLPSLISN